MEEHAERVARIVSQVQAFYAQKQRYRIFRGGATHSTRNQQLRGQHAVDTSELRHVIKVHAARKTALVEANVPMDRLVEATLQHRLIPPVVMEFPGITAGGGCSGTSGESSSFKHGFFDRTVCCIEMVLATGEVVRCSDAERPDLFRGAAGAMGTLGVVTMVEIRLERATKFVEITYHPVSNIEEAVAKTREFTSRPEPDQPDYVDGILYSTTSGCVMTGHRTDERKDGLQITRFSAPSDPWFSAHVEKLVRRSKTAVTELIPLADYLFRYDRGCFWMGYSIFDEGPWWLRCNRTTRRILDDFLHTRMLYACARSQPINIQIIHDVAVPMSQAADLIEWTTVATEIWPLWLCPLKQSPLPTLHPRVDAEPGELVMNIGLWGNPKEPSIDGYLRENKEIEAKLREVGGVKWGYSPHFTSEDEFWTHFDRKWYDQLREKYHATSLPTIYDKATADPVALEERWRSLRYRDVLPFLVPGPVAWPLWKAWRSGEWRWKRESTWMNWVPREK